MIINQDMKPEKQLYHLGARLINILKDLPNRNIELLYVFERMNRHESVSMCVFLLTLDWLFLLGVIAQDEGRIVKCF